MSRRYFGGGPSDNIADQVIRFTVVGGIAFAVDFSLFILATKVGQWNYLVSAGLAYMVGLGLNYSLCVRWVFPRRRLQNRQVELALFALVGLTGLALTEVILLIGKERLALDVGIAKVIALCFVAVWNFVVRKLFLFSNIALVPRSAAKTTA